VSHFFRIKQSNMHLPLVRTTWPPEENNTVNYHSYADFVFITKWRNAKTNQQCLASA